MIRVAIVDDHPLVRRGFREALATDAAITVVAETDRSDGVLSMLDQHPCDVLLLDLSLPGRGGLSILDELHKQFPAVHTLVVSSHDQAANMLQAIRAGAAGFISKAAPVEELLRGIHAVHETGRYITDAVAKVLVEFARNAGQPGTIATLSNREIDVLRRIAKGQSVSIIAESLSLSIKTVSTYRTRVLTKLGLSSTADVVRYAIAHHLGD
jgi:two-component system invasion response regulator UvrY